MFCLQNPDGVILFRVPAMPAEPSIKRAIAFFDGQNLYHAAKETFGYTYPNYDVVKLSKAVCISKGWKLVQVRFYTGVPDHAGDASWHRFWAAKFLSTARLMMRVLIHGITVIADRVAGKDAG